MRRILIFLGLLLALVFLNNMAPALYRLAGVDVPQRPVAEDKRPEIEWAQDDPPDPWIHDLVAAHRPLIAVTGGDAKADPFRQAIRRGDVAAVRRTLAKNAHLVRGAKHQLPPLFDAVLADNPKILRLLIGAGADIHTAYRIDGKEIHSPLSYAIWHKKRKSLFLLLAAGADAGRLVCAPGALCGNALSVAALTGDAVLLREIIERGKIGDRVINLRGIYAQHTGALSIIGPRVRLLPALHMAARAGHTETARTLLALGADLDRLDIGNKLAEYHASFAKAEAIQKLFAAERSRAGELVAAIQSGETGRVRKMLADGANPDFAVRRGPTPLVTAIGERDREAVKMLLAAGADPNRVVQESTPMQAAMAGRDVAIVRLLLAAGADPNEYRDGKMPPFAEAVLSDDRDFVQAFLDAGVSLTTRYKVRGAGIYNILGYAVLRNKAASAVLLARNGADPNLLACTADRACGNVLTLAALSGDANLVERLIREGKMPTGTINLTHVIETEHGLEAVVIRSGNESRPAFPSLRDVVRNRDGRSLLSPLQAARRAGHKQVIETLLALGAVDTGPDSGGIPTVD